MIQKLSILFHELMGILITFTGNPKKSSHHFLKAAKLGSPRAQNIIAAFYYEGRGVDQDNDKAFKWYKESASQGYTLGIANMGWAFYNGIGVPQDYSKSLSWYQKSAAQDHAESQYNLGYMYAAGLGVDKDLQKAKSWLVKAKQNKHEKAAEFLNEIST